MKVIKVCLSLSLVQMEYVNKDEQVQNKGVNSESSLRKTRAVQARHVSVI